MVIPSLACPGHQTILELLLEHNRSILFGHTHTFVSVLLLCVCVCVCVCVQAALYMTDPLQLTNCSLLSSHGHSPIVGIDMLSPGSDHIVVRCKATVHVYIMYMCVCVV